MLAGRSVLEGWAAMMASTGPVTTRCPTTTALAAVRPCPSPDDESEGTRGC